jgi:hypothetical protein
MTKSNTGKRAQILETVTHYITAFVVTLKGIDKVGNPEKVGYGVFFIIVGMGILIGTIFHHKFEHLIKNFKSYVLSAECVVMAIVGYLFVKEGTHYIQYVCFAASLAFLVALIVNLKKAKPVHH